MDLLDLFDRGSAWTGSLVAGAVDKLDAPTPCDKWNVRTLLNHMLDTQRYFTETAEGKDAQLGPEPPDALSSDPVEQYESSRQRLLEVYREEGVIEKTGPSLGIAFADSVIHGVDLARATGQDDSMPDGLAAAAYDMIHGRFTDEQRKGVFGSEIKVDDSASPQEKLLAYTGRAPN